MLWLLSTFPAWVFHSILIAGVTALIAGMIVRNFPPAVQYGFMLKLGGAFAIVIGLMFEGGLSLKKDYDLKEAELTAQLMTAQARGETIVVKVVEQIVYRDKIITKQGATVIQYIDRVSTVIDAMCTLIPEAVKAHNAAAAEPVVTGAVK